MSRITKSLFIIFFVSTLIIANTSCSSISLEIPCTQPQPASFDAVSLILITDDENVIEISANIKNDGDIAGYYNSKLLVNDNEIDSQAVSIAPGTTETLRFECCIRKGEGNIVKFDRFVVPVDQLIVLPFSKLQTYVLGGDSMFAEIAPPLNVITLPPLNLNSYLQIAETTSHSFVWLFDGITWKWEVTIPNYLNSHYRELERLPENNYLNYVSDTEDDLYLRIMLSEMMEAAKQKGYDEFRTVQFIAAFVQFIPYTSDIETTGYRDYPRYPIQTLADFGGDCEDKVILLSALLDLAKQDFVVVSYPEHCGIGILGNLNSYGSYWEHDSQRYFYLETSDWGWEIGNLPSCLADKPAVIYSLD